MEVSIMEDILLYFSVKYEGDFQKILKALQHKEKVTLEQIADIKKHIKSQYTTIISDDYPSALKMIVSPPFVLYYYGDLSILNQYCMAVIGSRHPDSYGCDITAKLIKELCQYPVTIVSGMAIGIDSIAHRNAIKTHCKTVAVLGSGIDCCYPKSNNDLYELFKKEQLIISEYPGFTPPQPSHFPVRNRIIAGLSASILVTQANQKSGTMITVGYALDQGKDIFCVPSRIGDPQGCNLLIQQGAKLVMNASDIIEDLEMRLTKS